MFYRLHPDPVRYQGRRQSQEHLFPVMSATEDINPAGNIAHAATRHLELISNVQTNPYQLLFGELFHNQYCGLQCWQKHYRGIRRRELRTDKFKSILSFGVEKSRVSIEKMKARQRYLRLTVGRDGREPISNIKNSLEIFYK
jgi:hypothetical protein